MGQQKTTWGVYAHKGEDTYTPYSLVATFDREVDAEPSWPFRKGSLLREYRFAHVHPVPDRDLIPHNPDP